MSHDGGWWHPLCIKVRPIEIVAHEQGLGHSTGTRAWATCVCVCVRVCVCACVCVRARRWVGGWVEMSVCVWTRTRKFVLQPTAIPSPIAHCPPYHSPPPTHLLRVRVRVCVRMRVNACGLACVGGMS